MRGPTFFARAFIALIAACLFLLVATSAFSQSGSTNVSVLRSTVTDSTTVTGASNYGRLYYLPQVGEWRIKDATGTRPLKFPSLANYIKANATNSVTSFNITESSGGLIDVSGGNVGIQATSGDVGINANGDLGIGTNTGNVSIVAGDKFKLQMKTNSLPPGVDGDVLTLIDAGTGEAEWAVGGSGGGSFIKRLDTTNFNTLFIVDTLGTEQFRIESGGPTDFATYAPYTLTIDIDPGYPRININAQDNGTGNTSTLTLEPNSFTLNSQDGSTGFQNSINASGADIAVGGYSHNSVSNIGALSGPTYIGQFNGVPSSPTKGLLWFNTDTSLAQWPMIRSAVGTNLFVGMPFTAGGQIVTSGTGGYPQIASGTGGYLNKSGSTVAWSSTIPTTDLNTGAARSVLGVTAGAASYSGIVSSSADQVLRVNGANTALDFGTVATGGITNDAVTYAKIQNVSAASKLLGRGDSGSGDTEEITLGSGLTMTGTTLSASGAAGVTSIATTSPITGGTITTTGTIGINNAAADGSTKGAASFTAADFDASSGNVSIDYTNGQAAATSTKGFLTSTDWNTFNGKQGTGLGYLLASGGTATGNNTDAMGTNTLTFTSSAVGNAYTFNSAFTATADNQGAYRRNGTLTHSSTSSRKLWLNQETSGITTGATNQISIVNQIVPTYTSSHTGNVIYRDYYDPTLAGAQTASAIHYNAAILKGITVFGAATATNSTAVLVDMVSTTQGFSPPKMTGAQRDAISSPFAGLLVYNSSSKSIDTYNGSTWTSQGNSSITRNTTQALNSGTSETDLHTFTIPANTINSSSSPILSAKYAGLLSDITASSQLKVYFGGQVIFDTGAFPLSNTGSYEINVTFIPTGSGTAKVNVTLVPPISIASLPTSVYTSLSSLNFTTTNVIKITGTASGAGGGSNDISCEMSAVQIQN